MDVRKYNKEISGILDKLFNLINGNYSESRKSHGAKSAAKQAENLRHDFIRLMECIRSDKQNLEINPC